MDKIEYFRTHARSLFSLLESEYHYVFEQEKIFRHADTDWSVKLLYFHEANHLRIELEQAPYYTDYGFTFSIRNTVNNEEVIVYNIGHENQDAKSQFLTKAARKIFSHQQAIDLISGKKWENHNKIMLQQ